MAARLTYLFGSFICAAMFIVARLDPHESPWLFFACLGAAAVAYLCVVKTLPRSKIESGWPLVICLGLAMLWRVPLVLSPLTLSNDVYRYVWDGRLQRLGYDPYTTIPADPRVAHLHTPETAALNHPEVPTPYPPVAELFFRAVTSVDESARAIKTAMALVDGLIALVLMRWLRASRSSRSWVLAYAWNPLVALEGAGSGHVDLLGVLFLVCAAACLSERRTTFAALLFALAVGVKFLPIVLVPLFWRRVRIVDAVAGAVLLAALYLPFTRAGHLPSGSVAAYFDFWRFNGPLFSTLETIAPARVVVGLAVLVGVGTAVWMRRTLAIRSPAAWAWPLAGALLVAPVVYPWYLVWLTPFLTTTATLPLLVWTLTVLVTYLDLVSGLPSWAVGLEYGAVAVAGLWVVLRHPRTDPPGRH